MAVAHLAGQFVTFLSTDTKPTSVPASTRGLETDTGLMFVFNGTSWIIAPENVWAHFHDFINWTSAVAGTGSATLDIRRILLGTGATASSTALARFNQDRPLWSSGVAGDVIDWSKRIIIIGMLEVGLSTTNGINRLTLGKNTTDGVAALTDKGIGIEVRNLALHGIVHNGTTGAAVNLSTSVTLSQCASVIIESDGAGNIEWFVDGLSVGTSAAGPIGSGTANRTILQLESTNGADAVAYNGNLGYAGVYVGQ